MLKQAYEFQRSDQRSWENIDQIISVVDTACEFLDLPEGFDDDFDRVEDVNLPNNDSKNTTKSNKMEEKKLMAKWSHQEGVKSPMPMTEGSPGQSPEGSPGHQTEGGD